MSPKWFIGFFMLFLILQVISGICELQYLGPGATTTIETLLKPTMPAYNNPVEGIVAFFSVSSTWLTTFWDVFWFKYPFFQGTWIIAKYLIFLPVSIGLGVTLILAAIGGRGSS